MDKSTTSEIEEGRQLWIKYAVAYGADEAFGLKTWDTYKLTARNESPVGFIRAIGFKEHFGAFIHGPPGTGKTHAMKARFADYVNWKVEMHLRGARSPSRAFWVTCSDFVESMRGKDDRAKDKLRDKVHEATTLFLDDLGTSTRSEWAVDQLLQLLDFRAERKLQTFITSNLSLEEIGAHYGARISSRVSAITVPVPMVGGDFRGELMESRMKKLIDKLGKGKT